MSKLMVIITMMGWVLLVSACTQPTITRQQEVDSEMAETGQSDTGQSDTGQSDTGQSDTAQGDSQESLSLADIVDVHQVEAIRARDDVVLIDVREQWEDDEAHIPGVTLIPLQTVPNNLQEIPTDKTVILTCRSGNRSGKATDFLRQQGYTNVHNMAGGILAWQQAGYVVE